MSQLFFDFVSNNKSFNQILELLPADTELSFSIDKRNKYTLLKSDQGVEVVEQESHRADLELVLSTECLRVLSAHNDQNIKEFLNAVFKELLAGGIQVRLIKHYSQLMAKGYMKVFELLSPYINLFMATEGYQNFMKLVDLAKRLKNNKA